MTVRIIILSLLLFASPLFAHEETECACANAQEEDFDVIDWGLARKRMESLSKVGYHPFLMPLIMENIDSLELTQEQIEGFKKWRKKNRVKILHLMDKIIYERNLFHRLSLHPGTREEVLLAKQDEIFKLQRKVLKYQLSCRREILDSFTEKQWDNFRFVLSANGYEVDM